MSGGLGFLGPLGDKLQSQGDRLDKRFCEVKGVLGKIAANSYPEHLRNDFSHKSVNLQKVPIGEEEVEIWEGVLENNTGFDWLIHAVASTQLDSTIIYWGSDHSAGFLGALPGGDACLPFVKWFLPTGTKLIVQGAPVSEKESPAVNFQVEIVRTPGDAQSADTGASSERYDTVRLPDERPTASILEG